MASPRDLFRSLRSRAARPAALPPSIHQRITGRRIAPAVGRDLQAIHVHERIRRGLGIKGGNAVSSLADELVPVILVDDLTQAEVGTTLVRSFTVAFEFTPVNNALFLLFNPLGSRARVIVKSIYRQGASPTLAFWRRQDSTAGFTQQLASGAGWSHELNGGATAVGVGGAGKTQLWTQDLASVPTISTGFAPWLFGASLGPWPINLVLGEGQGFMTTFTTVGVNHCAFEITERDNEP